MPEANRKLQWIKVTNRRMIKNDSGEMLNKTFPIENSSEVNKVFSRCKAPSPTKSRVCKLAWNAAPAEILTTI